MKISLKMRVFIVFFGVLFLLAGSYLFTVTRFITRFTTKQLNDDYNSLLLEISETMQNLLWNLTLTSGQLLDNDEIQDTVLAYQSSSSPYIRQEYYSSLLKDITMLTMANSDVSLLYLYDNEDEDFIFSSFPVQENRTGELPVLYENSAFVFCGPCFSQSNYNGNPSQWKKRHPLHRVRLLLPDPPSGDRLPERGFSRRHRRFRRAPLHQSSFGFFRTSGSPGKRKKRRLPEPHQGNVSRLESLPHPSGPDLYPGLLSFPPGCPSLHAVDRRPHRRSGLLFLEERLHAVAAFRPAAGGASHRRF